MQAGSQCCCGLMQNKDIKQPNASAISDSAGCGLMQNKDIKQRKASTRHNAHVVV